MELQGNAVTLGYPKATAVEMECVLIQPVDKEQQSKSLHFALSACLNPAWMSHLLEGHCAASAPGFSAGTAMNDIIYGGICSKRTFVF